MFIVDLKNISPSLKTFVKNALDNVKINCLFAHAVIDYKVKGILIVDSLVKPCSFYARHLYGMSLLFGDTTNSAFNKLLWAYLNRQNFKTEYLQLYPNSELSALAESAINVVELERINFKFNKDSFVANRKKHNTDYEMQLIDEVLFHKIDGSVVPRKFWRNGGYFSKNAKGVSIVKKGTPLSWAFAAFVHENYLELGIETHPDYRGNNLAYACCSTLIDHCLKSNYEPVWACRKDNIGSYKLALKLGFEPNFTIPYYEIGYKGSSLD